jgi:hypothetical protein
MKKMLAWIYTAKHPDVHLYCGQKSPGYFWL